MTVIDFKRGDRIYDSQRDDHGTVTKVEPQGFCTLVWFRLDGLKQARKRSQVGRSYGDACALIAPSEPNPRIVHAASSGVAA